MRASDILLTRNADFSASRFTPGLRLLPSLRAIVIGCADPRVDPAVVLGLESGEAAVIRNVGGRVTPSTVQTLGMLGQVAAAEGAPPDAELEVIVLHHTDCGITRLTAAPALLAASFGIAPSDLPEKSVADPEAAVRTDVANLLAALSANGATPMRLVVSGIVYDVATGRAERIVGPVPVDHEAAE